MIWRVSILYLLTPQKRHPGEVVEKTNLLLLSSVCASSVIGFGLFDVISELNISLPFNVIISGPAWSFILKDNSTFFVASLFMSKSSSYEDFSLSNNACVIAMLGMLFSTCPDVGEYTLVAGRLYVFSFESMYVTSPTFCLRSIDESVLLPLESFMSAFLSPRSSVLISGGRNRMYMMMTTVTTAMNAAALLAY